MPTFNRAKSLANCLNSINIASESFSGKFEVYVSRNCSSDQAVKMVENVKKNSKINCDTDKANLRMQRIFLKSVCIAKGS